MPGETAADVAPVGVTPIVLEGAAIPLSALIAKPAATATRATVVALHGAGMSAGYFDGQTLPTVSLLALGARLGFTVLAIDRPGYGLSAQGLPAGQTLVEQAATLRAAFTGFSAENDTGAGLFLVGHSFGAMLALHWAAAADDDSRMLGVDVSGCGHRRGISELELRNQRIRTLRSWGKPALYPPSTFRASAALVTPVPALEMGEVVRWTRAFPRVAARIVAPVRLTFAEYEKFWRHDAQALRDLRSRFSGSVRVVIDEQRGAGHNISLGWAARTYHLRALGFLEDCLLDREPVS